ncbi:MAG: HAD family hydrolase, partial [Anaerolineae bacterium]
VIFDLYGTLVRSSVGLESIGSGLAAAVDVPPEHFNRVREQTADDAMKGGLPTVEARAQAEMELLGVDASPEAVSRWTLAEREYLVSISELYPHVPSILSDLRNDGYRLGLISNCDAMGRVTVEELGLPPYFDAIRLSHEFGQTKPSPEIYLSICQELEVSPEECLYVGDGTARELEGASNVGMGVAWAAHDGGWARWRHVEVYHDHRLESLEELPELLRRLSR